MADTTIESLLEKHLRLTEEKNRLDRELEDVKQMMTTYLLKIGAEKFETANHRVSMRDDIKVDYIDKEAAMKYFTETGVMSQFIVEQVSAPKMKKYLLETGDTAGGTIEINPYKILTITAKRG